MRRCGALLALVAALLPAGSAGAAKVDPLALIVVPRSAIRGLPAGFRVALASGPTDNARAANDSFDPADTAADLSRAGRVAGYTLAYGDPGSAALRSGRGLLDIGTAIDVFSKPAQATAWAAKVRSDVGRLQGQNLDGIVIVSSSGFTVRGLAAGATGVRLVQRLGSHRVYSTYVDFRVNGLLLEASVSRADAQDARALTIRLAHVLLGRLGAYAAGKLKAKPVTLPRRSAASLPAPGVPDLSVMALGLADVRGSASAVAKQGYTDDLTAVAAYARSFRVGATSGLFTLSSSVQLERTAAEASGRLFVLRSIFAGPEGAATLVHGLAVGAGSSSTPPTYEGVRTLRAGDEAFAASVVFPASGSRARAVLVYVRRGHAVGSVLIGGRLGVASVAKALPLAQALATRMAPAAGPTLVA